MRIFIEAVGIAGPGLNGWREARAVLSGAASHVHADTIIAPILLLPPAERRRAGAVVRLAVGVGLDALAEAGRPAAEMATVFASSGSDGDTIHQMLSVLTTDPRAMSPTRFHNSVHNAPSGYWAVATGSREPSTSLCAFDDSFLAGLVDATAQSITEARPVTLIAYDMPYPPPLHQSRPIVGAFAVALVLVANDHARTIGCLDIGAPGNDRSDHPTPTPMSVPALEHLRAGNPAARCLPLLARMARGEAGHVLLDGAAGSTLDIHFSPRGTS